MLLAKSTASSNAEYILHNSIQLFTFVGTHFLQMESKSSFDIACTAIDVIVPHILSGKIFYFILLFIFWAVNFRLSSVSVIFDRAERILQLIAIITSLIFSSGGQKFEKNRNRALFFQFNALSYISKATDRKLCGIHYWLERQINHRIGI